MKIPKTSTIVIKILFLTFMISLILLNNNFVKGAENQTEAPAGNIEITENASSFTISNGIMTAQISKRNGDLTSLVCKGTEIFTNKSGHAGAYWSHDTTGGADTVTKVTIDPQSNGGQRGEVSVKGISGGKKMGHGPGAEADGDIAADIEIRYSMGRGETGIYTYCIFDHLPEYQADTMTEARFCAKLADIFDWISVAQDEHHNKHYPASLREGDKYVYTTNQYNNPAFGWSSTTKNIGFFIINPSMEYMSGGPTKVEFLGHRDTTPVAAPCTLNYWRSSHYGGAEVSVAAGEHWTKVIGPFLLYVNYGSDTQDIYKNAREQAVKEKQKWPFAWVDSESYAKPGQRATVKGQLVLTDPIMPDAKMSNVMVGLTAPAFTSAGFGGRTRTVDWQQDAKNYQFWVKGKDNGKFTIPNVVPGTYTLHAFADGVLGEFVKADVTVETGKDLNLDKITWTPVRRGKQLWDIGIPNRYGSEFFQGDVYYKPDITTSYGELFPDDITYVIGKSDYTKDWFFAHVPNVAPNPEPAEAPAETPAAPGARRGGFGGGFGFGGPVSRGKATPRTIVFEMPENGQGKATLRLAFCGTGVRSIAVAVNDESVGQLSNLPNDGVLSRHGMHGIWHEQEFTFDASMLRKGTNKLTLTVPAGDPNSGVIYDYLRLELNESN